MLPPNLPTSSSLKVGSSAIEYIGCTPTSPSYVCERKFSATASHLHLPDYVRKFDVYNDNIIVGIQAFLHLPSKYREFEAFE